MATPAAITGKVFFDAYSNGSTGSSETGLAKVAVSDGRTVVLTAEDGTYTIAEPSGPFVFVSLPRGYRSVGSFYARTALGEVINFAVTEWSVSNGDTTRFVQITDIHLGFTSDDGPSFKDDLTEINALEPKASFALVTGDMIHMDSATDQYDSYCEGIGTLDIPHFNLPGNHDIETSVGLNHYYNYLGPEYYSFNFAACHFVLINGFPYAYKQESLLEEIFDQGRQPSEEELPRGVTQLEWIKRDIAAAPAGSTIIFITHFLPTPSLLRFFNSFGAKAVLSGHWHGHRVCKEAGMLNINSAPLCIGSIDRHPHGFRAVEISQSGIRSELHLGGFKRHAAIVSPHGPQSSASETLPLLVNAYDTRWKIKSVTCQIGDQTISLHQTGDWSWASEIELPADTTQSQTVVATVQAENGETWQTESSFEPHRAPANLAFKWAAPTGGFIGISSPVVSSSSVVIGVDDTGNLEQCGVTAFDLDGSRRWHFATDSAIKNRVALADSRVFATSVAGFLYALDEISGKLLWKADFGRDKTRWEITATTVMDDVVHVGSSSYIAAFEATSGRLLWSTAGVGRNSSDWWPSSYAVPVVAHQIVLLSNHLYGAIALDAQSGKQLWKLEGKFTAFAVDGHSIYTLQDGLLTSLDIHTGEQIWQGAIAIKFSASNPVVAGDRVIIGTADGRVVAFSKQDGTQLWEYQTGPSLTSLEPYKRGGSDVNSTPAIAEGKVYIGASDGHLHVIALADGAKITTYPLGVPIASSPTIKDKTLYIGAYDGNVYAFALNE